MRIVIIAAISLSLLNSARGQSPYPRTGWSATLSTFAHQVSGTATIVDEDTFRLDNFFYDGGGISVFAYLGMANSNPSFAAGLQTGPQLLGTPFNGGSLVIDLPPGETLDAYHAISIWCVAAGANFGSGTFAPPAYPRAGFSALMPPGSHATHGAATIVDERTIRLDNFYYDGNAPQVYVNLGVDTSDASFRNGTWIGPQLISAYSNASLKVQFPPGQTVSGFGAICIWCEVINACFTRAAFPRTPPDLDIDGDVDVTDMNLLNECAMGPDIPGGGSRVCLDADLDQDNFVDLRDFADAVLCFSAEGERPPTFCIE